MILEEDKIATDTRCFPQQDGYIIGVVQNVHKEAAIKCPVGKRQSRAVKRAARDAADWPRGYLCALD